MAFAAMAFFANGSKESIKHFRRRSLLQNVKFVYKEAWMSGSLPNFSHISGRLAGINRRRSAS
jgi:hypothetical protein